jgi:predicted secreted protein
MADSNAFWAFGTILQLGDGAAGALEAFANIAELTEINPPSMTKDSIEVTNHSSAYRYREFKAGMKDGGSVSGKGNWLPNDATQDENTGLMKIFDDDLNHNWRLVLPDGLGTISFRGHVTAFTPETPLTAQGTLAFTIKVTGKPAFA